MFKKICVTTLAVLLVLLIAMAAQDSPNWTAEPSDSAPQKAVIDKSAITSAMADLNVPFLANRGQVDDRVKYYARTFGGMVFVTADGEIVYNLPCNDQEGLSVGHMTGFTRESEGRLSAEHHTVGLALREHLIDRIETPVHAEGPTIARISSFKGSDPAKWVGEIPGYALVDLGEVYDGINLKLRGSGDNVEKIFRVSPGARPDDIRLRLTGADRLQVNANGQLEAHSTLGSVAFTRPVAYQDRAGIREFVDVDYFVDGMEYGFALGDYDLQTELIIDPFLASTFLGGTGRDGYFEVPVLVDDEGNVYIASRTNSTDFPATSGAYEEENQANDQDIFIAKMTGDLTTLLAATYLGGSSLDADWPGVAMSLDDEGNVFVTGNTRSIDFPTTTGALSGSKNGTYDAFISKLDGDLTSLLASTFLGGSLNEYYMTIEAADNGDVFVVGTTGSDDFPFTQTGFDTLFAGGTTGSPYPGDLFVSRLDGGLTTLLASTYVGGSNDEYCEDIMLDSEGNIYLAGWVSSTNYPTTVGAYRRFHQGGYYDAFVTRLSADLTTLMASTFVGGSAWDFAYALTLDADDNAYITGHTASTNYPWIPGCYDITYNSDSAQGVGDDAFVTKLNPGLTTPLASTYLGGAGWEIGQALIVDLSGNIIVAGITKSSDFPWVAGALDSVYRGNQDIFVSRFDNNLQVLSASTYIGASEHDIAGSMALAADGYFYLAGPTNSPDYPSTPGAYNEDYNGGGEGWGTQSESWGGDVYISKVDLDWANKDWDSDGVINIEDNCIYEYNPGQDDTDGDGIGDVCDNCSSSYNPDQADINNNGIGDLCEIPETWYVTADGLGEAPTIQAAIDSCTHGDTVLVADGLYTGDGNECLDFHQRLILIRSENGPRATIIDCQASDTDPRRLFTFENGEDASFVVDGLTIRGGYGPVFNGSSSGGAMLFDGAAPTIKNCIFIGNSGLTGGAVCVHESSPEFINCTFAGNNAYYGAAVFSINNAAPHLENSIIAFNTGMSVMCLEGSIGLSCCDVFGNTGGDYIDCLTGQNGVDGNFSADPLFCYVGAGDIDLRDDSPCTAENNSCSVLIGAGQVGCTCNCDDFCDLDLSGSINPVDVVYMVNFVYKSQDAREQIPSCPGNNGDWNCDGAVNPVDVVYYVNSVYKSQGSGPCDPCACISYPDNCP